MGAHQKEMVCVPLVQVRISCSPAGATTHKRFLHASFVQKQITTESVLRVLTVLIQMVMESAPRAQPDARSALLAAALRHVPSASRGTISLEPLV